MARQPQIAAQSERFLGGVGRRLSCFQQEGSSFLPVPIAQHPHGAASHLLVRVLESVTDGLISHWPTGSPQNLEQGCLLARLRPGQDLHDLRGKCILVWHFGVYQSEGILNRIYLLRLGGGQQDIQQSRDFARTSHFADLAGGGDSQTWDHLLWRA